MTELIGTAEDSATLTETSDVLLIAPGACGGAAGRPIGALLSLLGAGVPAEPTCFQVVGGRDVSAEDELGQTVTVTESSETIYLESIELDYIH